MSALRELYQEMIIDHGRRPRNCFCLQNANHHAEGFNPLCGDRLTLYLRIEADVIQEVSFEGVGCAISTASASLMTEAIKGKTVLQAQDLFQSFRLFMTEEGATMEFEKLQILAGVREFPTRVKCATLAWHTLQAALLAENVPVTTE